MVEKLDKHIIMNNKIKWKNLPGVDKHTIYDMYVEQYNKQYNEQLEYKFINAKFVDFITDKVYHIDKNGNRYYIYHKNDFGRRIKTPYFKKMYGRRVNREGFNENSFYGYDKKPEVQLIFLYIQDNIIGYRLKNSKYKKCEVYFNNNQFDYIIVMKDGYRNREMKQDFKYKEKLGINNKLYKKIKNQAINDFNKKRE